MTNTFKLNIKDHWVDITDSNGNILYGFIVFDKQGRASYYEIVGATFNGARFSKEPIGWKRNHRGAVSQAFYDWFYEANKAIYQQFYSLKDDVYEKN